MDMQLVYGFVPNDGSLDALIERRANELATKIVLRTSNTMKLEDQGNSNKRIQKAIEEHTRLIWQTTTKADDINHTMRDTLSQIQHAQDQALDTIQKAQEDATATLQNLTIVLLIWMTSNNNLKQHPHPSMVLKNATEHHGIPPQISP